MAQQFIDNTEPDADTLEEGAGKINANFSELYGNKADAADLAAHTGDTTDAHDASSISFSPTGTVAATDVQAAIAEVASEGGGGGVTDHGALTGLADDDHTQYHTDARGDARYPPLARTISTTAPLTGGGSLSANRTLAIDAATTAAPGSMSAADKTKLDGIAASANNGLASVDGVSNAGGNVDFIALSGMTITSDDTANTVSFASSGGAGDMLSPLLNSEVSITGATTLTSTAFGKMHVLTGASSYTDTLPASSGNANKFIGFRVPSTVANTVGITLDGNASETIDGELTRVLNSGEVVILYCDGSNFHRVGRKSVTLVSNVYDASSDVQSGTTVAAATWTNTITDQNFTVFDRASIVQIIAGGVIVSGASTNLGSSVFVDGTTRRLIGGSLGTNYLGGSSTVTFPPGTFTAGTHTVRVQVWNQAGGVQYLRASSFPNIEELRIDVLEIKQ